MFIVFDLYVKGRPNALISIKRQGFRVTALWVYLGQVEGEGDKKMAEFWTLPSHHPSHHYAYFQLLRFSELRVFLPYFVFRHFESLYFNIYVNF